MIIKNIGEKIIKTIEAIIIIIIVIFLLWLPHFIEVTRVSNRNNDIVKLENIPVLETETKQKVNGDTKEFFTLRSGEYSSSTIDGAKVEEVGADYLFEDLKYYDTKEETFMTNKFQGEFWITYFVVYAIIFLLGMICLAIWLFFIEGEGIENKTE